MTPKLLPAQWPPYGSPAFRHDPVKSVLPGDVDPAVAWEVEPVVQAHRRITYENKTLERTIAVPVSATPAIVGGAGVVAASDDGRVRLFNPDLSKVYWERRLDASVYASVVVDRRRRRVVVASTSGLVACFDLRGALAWSVRLGGPVFGTPTVLPGSDVLVVAAFGSRCTGLTLENGDVVFDSPLPPPWHAAVGGLAAHRDPYAGPVATSGGNAVVCCGEHVVCLAPDGMELWRRDLGHALRSSPAVLAEVGEVAVCSVDGRCHFLDERTGAVRAEVFLGGKVTASPAVSGGMLVVGTQADVSVGVDWRTRTVAWTYAQGGPRAYTSYSVLPDGNVVVTSTRGTVLSLQPVDGRFRWETSQVLGLPDHEPAMDVTPVAGPDGSMYCASYSGDLYRFMFRMRDQEDTSC